MPHPSPCRYARGFTLVELSIVLVIISLLVGALVGLRSYVNNARLSNVMNESKIYINAFNQFQTRYGSPPGDYATASSAWTGAGNGDGNGLIRAATTAVPLERYYAFQHLALAGFISGSYTGAVNGTGGATIGLNVPGSSMDKVSFIFDHPDQQDGILTSADSTYFAGTYGNILRIAGLNDNATNIPDQPFLTPKQAYQLDDKFDDGQPGTGNIVTPISTALSNCATTAVSTTAAYASATTYADTKTCYLFVKIQ